MKVSPRMSTTNVPVLGRPARDQQSLESTDAGQVELARQAQAAHPAAVGNGDLEEIVCVPAFPRDASL